MSDGVVTGILVTPAAAGAPAAVDSARLVAGVGIEGDCIVGGASGRLTPQTGPA